jgi:REP element-mobilizing transposase RayT
MPQSFAQIHLHLVFSTKGRIPALQDKAFRHETHRYIGGTCNRMDCPAVCVGGVADHVHILCLLSRTISVAGLVQELKKESSKWLKTKDPSFVDFHWQSGYGRFRLAEVMAERFANTSRIRNAITLSNRSRTSSDGC